MKNKLVDTFFLLVFFLSQPCSGYTYNHNSEHHKETQNKSSLVKSKTASMMGVNNNPTIAIIGGGTAGVSTASFLRGSRHQVHLFEKKDQVGGHAKTHTVPNGIGDQTVAIDLGPQYFAKPAWNVYIEFLKAHDLYKKSEVFSFTSNLTVTKDGCKYPTFYAPGSPHFTSYAARANRPIRRALSLFNFINRAYSFYEEDGDFDVTVGDFTNKVGTPKRYQDEFIKPLLAGTGNAPLDQVDQLSIRALTEVLAFRSPLRRSAFEVSRVGMGVLIQRLAAKLENEWKPFHLHLSSPVERIVALPNGGFRIEYNGGRMMIVDKVISAVHPYTLGKLMDNQRNEVDFSPLVDQFTYADAHLVLHNDQSYIDSKFPSFFNIHVKNNKSYILTMNLKHINKKYGNVLKSWVNDADDFDKLQKDGKVLADVWYKHPVVNPTFLRRAIDLKAAAAAIGDMWVVGGWAHMFETQYNAILSSYVAIQEIAPSHAEKWLELVPSLKKG